MECVGGIFVVLGASVYIVVDVSIFLYGRNIHTMACDIDWVAFWRPALVYHCPISFPSKYVEGILDDGINEYWYAPRGLEADRREFDEKGREEEKAVVEAACCSAGERL